MTRRTYKTSIEKKIDDQEGLVCVFVLLASYLLHMTYSISLYFCEPEPVLFNYMHGSAHINLHQLQTIYFEPGWNHNENLTVHLQSRKVKNQLDLALVGMRTNYICFIERILYTSTIFMKHNGACSHVTFTDLFSLDLGKNSEHSWDHCCGAQRFTEEVQKGTYCAMGYEVELILAVD